MISLVKPSHVTFATSFTAGHAIAIAGMNTLAVDTVVGGTLVLKIISSYADALAVGGILAVAADGSAVYFGGRSLADAITQQLIGKRYSPGARTRLNAGSKWSGAGFGPFTADQIKTEEPGVFALHGFGATPVPVTCYGVLTRCAAGFGVSNCPLAGNSLLLPFTNGWMGALASQGWNNLPHPEPFTGSPVFLPEYRFAQYAARVVEVSAIDINRSVQEILVTSQIALKNSLPDDAKQYHYQALTTALASRPNVRAPLGMVRVATNAGSHLYSGKPRGTSGQMLMMLTGVPSAPTLFEYGQASLKTITATGFKTTTSEPGILELEHLGAPVQCGLLTGPAPVELYAEDTYSPLVAYLPWIFDFDTSQLKTMLNAADKPANYATVMGRFSTLTDYAPNVPVTVAGAPASQVLPSFMPAEFYSTGTLVPKLTGDISTLSLVGDIHTSGGTVYEQLPIVITGLTPEQISEAQRVEDEAFVQYTSLAGKQEAFLLSTGALWFPTVQREVGFYVDSYINALEAAARG